MNTQLTFKKGIKDGLPICIGYFSVSFAFGIFAVNSGLNVWQTLLISMTNVTSAGQLAGVPIIVNGGTLIEMAASQLIINLRYALMSISLSQKLKDDIHFKDRFWIAFMNTDEIFAVSMSQKENVNKKYLFGLVLTPYFGWQTGTLLGAVAGDILPSVLTNALGIAIYGMFIAIVVPVAKENRMVLYCSILSILISCFCTKILHISMGFTIIISAILASLIFAIIKSEVNNEI